MSQKTRSARSSVFEFLRQDGASRCQQRNGLTPLIYLDKGEKLRILAGVQASMKQIGITTSEQRHTFWEKLYGLNLKSTAELPRGYAVAFSSWVNKNPVEAMDLGERFVIWYTRNFNAE